MPSLQYFPHIDLLLAALRINRERLNSKSKVAIEARLLRLMLQTIVEQLPFSETFYRQTYPDLADAHQTGAIPDLHQHFIESGFFEGRFGAPPPIDEAYYAGKYADVAEAIRKGIVKSGAEHYMRSGASEGRVPNDEIKPNLEIWMNVLREEVPRSGV